MAFLHPVDIDALNARAQGSLVEHVGIVVTAAGDDWLRGTMPVDARTRQPYGLLHGGASVVLAETLGSMAGGLCVDPAQQAVVGLEINANHLRAAREGVVPDGATLLTLVIEYPDKETRDMILATGMTDGMEASYARLEETVLAAR